MLLRFQGLEKKKVEAAAEKVARTLESWSTRSKSMSTVEVLGPSEAPIFRLRNKYRYQILVKSPKTVSLSQVGWSLLDLEAGLPKGVRMLIDIDPINML